MERNFNHMEAFCLMKYAGNDVLHHEYLYNTRDGVTPFSLTLLNGQSGTHTEWHRDRRIMPDDPDLDVHLDEADVRRVFVDLTRERAEEVARQQIERFTQGMSRARRRASHVPSVKMLVDEYFRNGTPPDVMDIEVWRASRSR